jgi:addiction module HigA family antidote
MVTKKNTFNPDYAIHPGEYLGEVLEARDLKKMDFARRCGMSEKQISQILGKHASISSSTALVFEKTLGISASIWNNINAQYQLFRAKEKERTSMERKKEWLNLFPLKELKNNGFLSKITNVIATMDELLSFFGVSSPEVWESYYMDKAINYRKSEAYKENFYSTITWLRIGEIIAGGIEVQPFNKSAFKKNIKKIRNLTTQQPTAFEPEMKQLCSESGVVLVFVSELSKTHICGAAEWLNNAKALIVMSLRYKTNDHFWFCFFHEAAHILLHGKKSTFIDMSLQDSEEKEKEANDFSCNLLITPAEYKRFLAKNKFYESDIIAFANNQNIAPGIIVGMLQHDRKIPFNFHNTLKEKYTLTGSLHV